MTQLNIFRQKKRLNTSYTRQQNKQELNEQQIQRYAITLFKNWFTQKKTCLKFVDSKTIIDQLDEKYKLK
jgi:hypothetical protein